MPCLTRFSARETTRTHLQLLKRRPLITDLRQMGRLRVEQLRPRSASPLLLLKHLCDDILVATVHVICRFEVGAGWGTKRGAGKQQQQQMDGERWGRFWKTFGKLRCEVSRRFAVSHARHLSAAVTDRLHGGARLHTRHPALRTQRPTPYHDSPMYRL